ncbi:MAG TPA: ABC transporter substrate-binding protein [Terrimicrobiaceae bacterium]
MSPLLVALIAAVALTTGCKRQPAPEPAPVPQPQEPTPASPSPTVPLQQQPQEPVIPDVPPPTPEPTKQAKPSEDPLATRVGFFVPLSGSHASFGADAVSGANLAVEEINLAGGVLDHPMKLLVKDTESKPEKTSAIVSELIENDKVAILIGEITTDGSLAAAPIAQQHGLPMITPGATNDQVTAAGNYIFRTCYTDTFQAAVMARFARSIGVEQAAILFDASNPYGSGLRDAFKTDFVKRGGAVIAEESYHAGDADFSAQLNAIKTKNPESIFLPSYYTDAALIIKQARQLGIDVPFLGTDGWDSQEFLHIGGQAVNNCYFACHFSSERVSEKVKAFNDAYGAKFESPPPPLAALAYDSVWLGADALKRAGSSEPAAIREALTATKDFVGVTGTITMDPDRNPKKPGIVIRVQDGKFTYLETTEP